MHLTINVRMGTSNTQLSKKNHSLWQNFRNSTNHITGKCALEEKKKKPKPNIFSSKHSELTRLYNKLISHMVKIKLWKRIILSYNTAC
jgi:hypothetical protein